MYFSVVTRTEEAQDSKENEKLDQPSYDSRQDPSSNSSESEFSDDESNTESEQEETEYVCLSII